MKRNLLSILILALLIVNLGMNGFLLFNVMSTNSKSAKLIGDISAAIELEKNGGVTAPGSGPDFSAISVSMQDTGYYELAAIGSNFKLKNGEDGGEYYVQTGIQLLINKKDKDYKQYNEETIATMQSTLYSIASEVISSYTISEAEADTSHSVIKNTMLQRFSQRLDGSQIIYDIDFPGWISTKGG